MRLLSRRTWVRYVVSTSPGMAKLPPAATPPPPPAPDVSQCTSAPSSPVVNRCAGRTGLNRTRHTSGAHARCTAVMDCGYLYRCHGCVCACAEETGDVSTYVRMHPHKCQHYHLSCTMIMPRTGIPRMNMSVLNSFIHILPKIYAKEQPRKTELTHVACRTSQTTTDPSPSVAATA